MSEDLEKKRARDRKYRQSEKGKATTQRYLESHRTELARKREEKKQRELEMFCRHFKGGRDVYCVRRLIGMRAAGKDIDFDKRNAECIYAWENRGRSEKKGEKPSVASMDYY